MLGAIFSGLYSALAGWALVRWLETGNSDYAGVCLFSTLWALCSAITYKEPTAPTDVDAS